jgi:chaperonin GroES
MSTQPLHDRLLVRRIPEQGPVGGEIVIPGTAKRKPWKGEVLVVGQGKDPAERTDVMLDVKIGDKVLFGRQSGIDIKIGGEDLLILPEDAFLEVLA